MPRGRSLAWGGPARRSCRPTPHSSSAPATPPAAPSPGASHARAMPPASPGAASTSCSRWWRRSEADGGQAHGFACDARKEEEVVALVEQIEGDHRPDRGAGVQHRRQRAREHPGRKPRASTSRSGRWPASRLPQRREAAKRMAPRGQGRARMISSRAPRPRCAARANFAAFCRRQDGPARAGPEHGARAGAAGHPRGARGGRRRHRHRVHPRNFPERYALKESDGILNPEHIADTYWMLHSQPRDAWTHELDLRPVDGEILMSETRRSEAGDRSQGIRRVLFRRRQPRRLPGLDAAAAPAPTPAPPCAGPALAAGRRVPGHRQPLADGGAGQGPYMTPTCSASPRALRRGVPPQPALPDQHADADARRAPACRCAAGRCGPTSTRSTAPSGSRAAT
jgi:hypothetical protein